MNNPRYIKSIYILFKKELMSYFNSPIAYVFIGVFLIVGNWLFFSPFYLQDQATLRGYFGLLPWIFMFLAPAITMRLWPEEKQTGTIEFLLTLPITNWQAVLAKFLSALMFLAIALALTLSLPISVNYLGNIDLGPVIGSYIGAILLGSAYLSLGLFISSLTKNQIIAFILALAACFAVFIIGSDFVVVTMPNFIGSIFKFIGLGEHFYNIARGVIDSKDVIYYLSFSWFFLWLNVKVLQQRSWH
ncbi:MAG: ABC transporter permease subunit [bacterium]